MLEKIPHGVGRALRGVRAGFEKVASEDRAFAGLADTIALTSDAFDDGGALPPRFTADGEGLSPPLSWTNLPPGAAAAALLVEDPDAPALEPLVHLLAWDLPADLIALPEGQLRSPGHDGLDESLGKNSFLQAGWLPPDPPTGHGPHLYVFQLFALDRKLAFEAPPSRGRFLKAIEGHVLAKGMLVATHERP
ncbi:YbhB/YbcL family Raf kinase inhibitor-like protein [Caulobacter flavus]|uniref:YbhB/YbcL family Raf kinase inhibitor-like protein n=1 Tax=Caulobacter flavus TaxID=1679497 RepID=A0A2N5CP61_9CAUL|nr:YbhB/YbcL family Raf kinase inhibitor-like protein [Caulobacter flavus]AYV48544.1 YbhB/YbcL family Raf kinase inhibitor-like protein [Caulobacter flavus]PLR08740.1 YbhB/YbcL family Raf kinase inhibitor-like protein [Caulobacter flavus]